MDGKAGGSVLFARYAGSEVKLDGDEYLVIRESDLADPYQNMGAQMLKQAATKTNDVAGDGTTTATTA